jgi:hypothetical protein
MNKPIWLCWVAASSLKLTESMGIMLSFPNKALHEQLPHNGGEAWNRTKNFWFAVCFLKLTDNIFLSYIGKEFFGCC